MNDKYTDMLNEELRISNLVTDALYPLKDTETIVMFKDKHEKREKLREWTLLSKIKTIRPKYINDKLDTYCDILGYISKETQKGCVDKIYETLIIIENNVIHKISIPYLKQMQFDDFKTLHFC